MQLKGKRAFIAGVADDQGYGWAIAKALAAAGAEILIGTWTPLLKIFETQWETGKFDESRRLEDGTLFQIAKIYSLDASFDTPADVPEEIRENKRYKNSRGYTISEVAEAIQRDFGSLDILVHCLANGPEVKRPLLETSRSGYLAAVSSSSYSFVSMIQRFGPFMNAGSSALSLTYLASERAVPGYGGGMSSAKAALESDTRMLAWEAGRAYGMRINTISAGPLGSRAAKAIGFIERMIDHTVHNTPLGKAMAADEVGDAALFLCSPLARAITGIILYVDHGFHAMGVAVDSPSFQVER